MRETMYNSCCWEIAHCIWPYGYTKLSLKVML